VVVVGTAVVVLAVAMLASVVVDSATDSADSVNAVQLVSKAPKKTSATTNR
jgi:hypothetical protein